MVEKKTLSEKSLSIIEKILLSEIIKLKREARKIPLYRKNYSTNLIACGRAYDEVLEAIELYGLMK